MPEEKFIYTFTQQTMKGGYYYIAVFATNSPEAKAKAENLDLKYKIGDVLPLSTFNTNELVLTPAFRNRMEKFGFAHRFIHRWPPSYSERVGHYGFLLQ